MNQEPLISLIVPCRNEKNFIRPCLDSILANELTGSRLEVFVVDGASDDGTRDIVQDYVNRHPNIRLIDNPARVTPLAMNLGIRQSRGEIIARLNGSRTVRAELPGEVPWPPFGRPGRTTSAGFGVSAPGRIRRLAGRSRSPFRTLSGRGTPVTRRGSKHAVRLKPSPSASTAGKSLRRLVDSMKD